MSAFVGKEKTSAKYTFTLKDENGNAVASASLSTLTLTLKNLDTGLPINLRDAQNVLNLNNVTIHATSGLLTWAIQPLDMVVVDAKQLQERHRATFRGTTSGGVQASHEVTLYVQNLADVS